MNKLFSTLCLSGTLFISLPLMAESNVNIQNGQQLFESNCIVCHGPQGHGDGIAAPNLSHKPANIHNKLTAFFADEQDLTDDVLEGKEGMPAFRGRLSRADIADIFAYIRSVN